MSQQTSNDASLLDALRPTARTLPPSGILKVFNYGAGRPGLIPLWAGEGDLPTPAFICEAAAKSLAAGETFYTANRGIPPLRQALARYTSGLYGIDVPADEFFVTGGGMQAIQIAFQITVGPGDEVIVPTPAWPNFEGAIRIQGAEPRFLPMSLTSSGWTLSLDALFAAVTPRTKAIVINSPANPTGWTASEDELKAILDFARARGLWIVADEIYARFYFAGAVAPSFQTLRRPDDKIVFVNTFSKNWAMTGWRIGWIQAPVALAPVIESHIQYNTSGVAPFMQRAAVVAIEEGEPFARQLLKQAADGRDVVTRALAGLNRVSYVPPQGAFYAFFGIDGMTDSMAAALNIIDEANVGLAPGTAFGPGAGPYFRICFLRSKPQLEDAMTRLSTWLTRQA